MAGDRDHDSTPSKSAEPTRTRVAPSSMAASKSFDIPIDSSTRGKSVRCRSVVAQLAEPARTTAAPSRPSSPARPSSSIRRSGSCGRPRSIAASLRICSDVQPCLLGFARGIDLQADRRRIAQVRRRLVEDSQQLERVDRMNHPDHRQRFLDLVGLQVSNQMPADRRVKVGQSLDLAPELLGIVFAEIAGSAGDQRPDRIRRDFSWSRRPAARRRPVARIGAPPRRSGAGPFQDCAGSVPCS